MCKWRCFLVQEYVQGVEYVIDTVSLNGVHKCVALWEYDRRPTNGAGFVLHGQKLLTIDDPRTKEMMEYEFKVLTALNIKNGPGHGEVKWFNGEIILIEVGSRPHGMEGLWIPVCNEVYGRNQVNVALDAYTDAPKFEECPKYPDERKAYGAAKFLISHVSGTFHKYNEDSINEIKAISSFRSIGFFLKKGIV